ncbi:TPA: hypothetical protein KDY87_000604 [Vibrio parahaemolyticus]|nr:hypothetical protein D5E83_03875 [Vibrio parahaemolyticus]HBC3493288.1 hypothetical protein [Vibrio parahaemolyticus]
MSVEFKVAEKNFSVVLLGKFNVLHHIPENLEAMGLLNSADKASTQINFVSAADIQLSLPWGHLRIDPATRETNRLSIFLSEPSLYTIFKDFVIALLNYNDTAMPYVMGINHRIWITQSSQRDWDHFGDCLTPKEAWLELFGTENSRAGMNEVSMKIDSVFEPTFSSDQKAPELNVSIKPVTHLPDGKEQKFCSECALNFHFPLDLKNNIGSAFEIMEVHFDELFHSGEARIAQIVERFS